MNHEIAYDYKNNNNNNDDDDQIKQDTRTNYNIVQIKCLFHIIPTIICLKLFLGPCESKEKNKTKVLNLQYFTKLTSFYHCE